MMPMTVSDYLGIRPGFMDGTQIVGSSFEAHVAHAALALEAGYCKVALITYGSTQRSFHERIEPSRQGPWDAPGSKIGKDTKISENT